MTLDNTSNQTTIVEQQILEGERAGFASKNTLFANCVFGNGESPLKESCSIKLDSCHFEWKYPLWYCKDVRVTNGVWLEMARSGVWYTNHIAVENSVLQAPKNFRRCHDVLISNTLLSNAEETLWMCDEVHLKNIQARGDYFAMNSKNIVADNLSLTGNYSFDGASNVQISNSTLISKDAFWNTENVVVKNSRIVGEYLGWNSKNLVFENCTVESLQGLCYINNLKMINCTLLNTTLAFEYSTVDVQINSCIQSVLNPAGGTIVCEKVGELILEPDQVDPSKTRITCSASMPQVQEQALWRK